LAGGLLRWNERVNYEDNRVIMAR